jgi:hypothetical protein
MAANTVNVTSLEDLALLNEDNAIQILLNGSEKYLAMDWIEGENARGGRFRLGQNGVGNQRGLVWLDRTRG